MVKTLSSAYFGFSDQSFVFTEALDDAALKLDGWKTVPLVVQELVEGLDARVVSFSNQCYGARCRSKGVDWRKMPFDPDLWERWSVPSSLEQSCHSYRRKLGLEYAAFDFMLRDGSPEFLEANQAGEWLFLDKTLEFGISRHLAERFIELSSACPDAHSHVES